MQKVLAKGQKRGLEQILVQFPGSLALLRVTTVALRQSESHR